MVDGDYNVEPVVGVLASTPFMLLLLALPKMIRPYFSQESTRTALAWFLVFASLVPLINASFLLFLPFTNQRYAVDFLPYLFFLLSSVFGFWQIIPGHPGGLSGSKGSSW
jgi:hypothetical protein